MMNWKVRVPEVIKQTKITVRMPEIGIQVRLEDLALMTSRQAMEAIPWITDPDAEEKWMKLEQEQEEKERAMEVHHKHGRTGMRIEFGWMKRDEIQAKRLYNEGMEMESDLVPCRFDDKEATMTVIMFSAQHPVDYHEYGMSVTLTEVTDEVPFVAILSVYRAFYEYLRDHSLGKETNEPRSE